MFGLFSLPKLLFTAAVIAAVLYGFKWLNRRQQMQAEDQGGKPKANVGGAQRPAEAQPDIEEMVPCPDCGAYVAKGSDHRCT